MNELSKSIIGLVSEAVQHRRDASAHAGGKNGTCALSVACGMTLNDADQHTYGIRLCGEEINHREAREEIIRLIDAALDAAKVTHEPRYTEKFGADCWKLHLTYDADMQWTLGFRLNALNLV